MNTTTSPTKTLLLVALLSPLALTAGARPAHAETPHTTVTWHGHAAFEITTPKGKTLLIDPWLKNPVNPAAQGGKDPVAALKKVDYILITHGHGDHVGDAVAIAKKTGARLVTNFELGNNMAASVGFPDKQMGFDSLINIGGEITIADGEVTVAMVPAVHSSGLDTGVKGQGPVYGGNPAGFVLHIKDGPTIYDTGDTAYFGDMALIGESAPDLALINIGGHFGMEPPMAARAAKAVKAKLVIPHHFKSFPILTQDTGGFFKELDKLKITHRELAPGESITFDGNKPAKK